METMRDADSAGLTCAKLGQFATPVANTGRRTRTTTTLESKCPVAIGTKPGPPPNLFLVTLSPIPMNLDAALAKLLKTLGVHEMDRVSAQEIHFSVTSKKIALGLQALNGLAAIGRHKLEVTVHEAPSAMTMGPGSIGGHAH
ncbi:unnamed protein product, partial [Durusdinium trenchii]